MMENEKAGFVDLTRVLQKFVDDNNRSSEVRVRWFCSKVREFLTSVLILRDSRIDGSKVPPEIEQAIKLFRIAEIDNAEAKLHKDIEAFEREKRHILAHDQDR